MKIKITFVIIFVFLTNLALAKELWVLDKKLSNITFELPVLLGKNVKGEFKEIEGLVEINPIPKEKSKAIISVKINSIEINYEKYKNLLLSEIFFYEKKYPIALIDTGKFIYNNEKKLNFDAELNIKGVAKNVPVNLEVIYLTNDLVQILGTLKFSRTEFNIGSGKWSSTAILRDTIRIDTNLFFFRN